MNHAPLLLLSLLALAPVATAFGIAATVSEGETTADVSPASAAIPADGARATSTAPLDHAPVAMPARATIAAGQHRFAIGDTAAVVVLPSGRADTQSNEWVAIHLRASPALGAPLAPPVSVNVDFDANPWAAPRPDPTGAPHDPDLGARDGTLPPGESQAGTLDDSDEALWATRAARVLDGHRRSGAQEPPVGIAAVTAQAALTRATTSHAAASLALLALLTPWVLYHRARGHRVLDQSTRNRIFAALEAHPGLSPADTARQLELDPTTVRYHLRRLVKEGLVFEEGRRRAIRYFPRGSVAPADRAAHVAAQQARPVFEAVKQNPGTSKSEIARSLGLARATVAWHLDRLARVGLVRFRRDGRTVLVELAQSAHQA